MAEIVAIFHRRATDRVDGRALTAYRTWLRANLDLIEEACDAASQIADDLRRRIREPDDIAEPLASAEAQLDAVASDFAEQVAPEPLQTLHAEFDANLERALRGLVTIERGCGLTRLQHATIYDDGPQAYWKRGHLNVIHAQMRMREIAHILFTWRAGLPAEATIAARIQQLRA